jgi:hypothetical protein
MNGIAAHCTVALLLLIATSACSNAKAPLAPDVVSRTPVASPAPEAGPNSADGRVPAFPGVSRPARVFIATDWPTYAMHGSPLASRFLLYEESTFSLQYASANYPFFEYRGSYEEDADAITFHWGVCCGWGAMGVLRGDALTVKYSEQMEHSDFLSGVYVRASDAS